MASALRNVAFSALMVVLTVVLLEATFQVFPTVLPDRLSYFAHQKFIKNYGDLLTLAHGADDSMSGLFEYHPRLGWIGKPNLRRTQWSLDGEFDLATNSLGFRDVEWSTPRPDRTRIVVLGDSFTWGLPINQDDLLPQRLGSVLREAGYAVDTYNLGVNGYGTDQEYLAFEEYGLAQHPDLVVLVFFYSNDFWNNGASVSSFKAKPYFVVGDDGTLELRNVPVPRRSYRDSVVKAGAERDAPRADDERTSLVRVVKDQLFARSILYPLLVGAVHRSSEADVTSLAAASDRQQAGGNVDHDKVVTREIIRALAASAGRQGADFLVLLFPGYGYDRGARHDYEETAEFFRNELPDIRVCDLTPAFERSSERLYGSFIEHWTAAGSRLAADELGAFIQKTYAQRLIKRRDG